MKDSADYYKLRADLVIKRRIWGDDVKYIVKDPLKLEYFTLDEFTWSLLNLCDGTRDLGELVETIGETFPDSGLDPLTLRTFFENYRAADFFEDAWQRNVLVMEQRRNDRSKVLKKAMANPFEIQFPAWNPDKLFGLIVKPLGFLFTRTAVYAYILIFLAATYISFANARDFALPINELYTIQGRALTGVLVLWTILLFSVVLHEIGHGLTCKHFGGGVYKIGFLLLYFNPCMFCDVTEGYFFEKKSQKQAVTLAGGVVDLMVAALSTFIWYFTERDLFINEVAHRVALYNGVTGIMINFNPLMKYDGYYVLSDHLDMPNLQGDSFRFLGNKVRKMFGLACEEEPFTPRERKILGWYGFFSILYIIFVLTFIFLMVSGWLISAYRGIGYILSAGLLFMLTRKYLRKLIGFGRFAALDKAGHFVRFRFAYLAGVAALIVAFFFVPISRNVRGQFSFRAGQEAVIRAGVPGVIDHIFVDEGESVRKGDLLMVLRDEQIDLARRRAVSGGNSARVARASAIADRDLATARAYEADAAASLALERYHDGRQDRTRVIAPFDGVVMTPRLAERIGEGRLAGDELLELGDPSVLHAEVTLDEQLLGILDTEAVVGLRTQGDAGTELLGTIVRISQAPSGGRIRRTYRVVVAVDNAGGELRPGMIGVARFQAGKVPAAQHLGGWLSRMLRIDFWV